MRVCCVFSGGGAKTAAQVGSHRALDESGIAVDRYVGTSMGAVIGACFASGMTYDEVLSKITNLTRSDFATPAARSVFGPFAEGLFSVRQFKETLDALLPAGRFDELAKPLTVTATDLASGELITFGDGGNRNANLVDALYASCALPVYYPPAELDQRRLADGGLASVMPLRIAAGLAAGRVFGVMVGPVSYDEDFDPRGQNLMGAYNSALRILMAAQAEREIANVREDLRANLVLVKPAVGGRATFEVENVVTFVENGYRAARAALREAKWIK